MPCLPSSILYFSQEELKPELFPVLSETDLHIWRFSFQDAEAFAEPETCLSQRELIRLSNYRDPSAALCYRVGHMALRRILSGYLGIPPAALDIQENPYGKLFLKERSLFFNLSHAGEYILLAFCRFSPVGVDLEEVYDLTLAGSVVKRFFHPDERGEYSRLSGPAQMDWFFRRWTVREAYVKALGTGLSTSPESFYVGEGADGSFSVFPDRQDSGQNQSHSHPNEKKRRGAAAPWRILPLDAPTGYFASVCVSAPCLPDSSR